MTAYLISVLHTNLFIFVNYHHLIFLNSIIETNAFIFFNYYTLLILNIESVIETNMFIMSNYYILLTLNNPSNLSNLMISYFNTPEVNSILSIWFPWESFLSFTTILGVLYVLTFLSIYNTENSYYLVLYLVFLVFLFAGNLVILDLDIFAGLLLLIESVVILMLFFLIIYLTPNINFRAKINTWKVWTILFIIMIILSFISYLNLSTSYTNLYAQNANILDDFYEAMNDIFLSELTGIYASLYWTNSVLLFIIGVLLLIASIICVVLVSFFTKLRVYNINTFIEFFDIAKSCYSLIFLRKQHLAKQGRGNTSTRIFKKKNFNSDFHTEYKEKQSIFENNQKTNI